MCRYSIFLSFSGDDNDHCQNRISKFYNNLNSILKSKLGLSKSEEVIFYSKEIEIGNHWTDELKESLNTSKVFLYMHSPSYYKTEYCGKEWLFFSERMEKIKILYGFDTVGLMIPVIWFHEPNLPECVCNIQYNQMQFGSVYEEKGLNYLMRIKSHEDDYEIFIERFSDFLIQKIRETKDLPYHVIDRGIESLGNPFSDEEKPKTNIVSKGFKRTKYAQFAYLACTDGEVQRQIDEIYGDESNDWKPFYPQIDLKISFITQSVAAKVELDCKHLDNFDEPKDIIDDSRENNRIVLTIVDPWSVNLPKYNSIIKKCDEINSYNFAMMIPFNLEDDETRDNFEDLNSTLLNVCRSKSANTVQQYFNNKIYSYNNFCDELAATLIHVKNRIAENTPYIRKLSSNKYNTKPELIVRSRDTINEES